VSETYAYTAVPPTPSDPWGLETNITEVLYGDGDFTAGHG
jgi:hypothetical protein